MGFRGLREWIDILEAEGEIMRIKAEVDWNLELAGVGRRAPNDRALLFENIKDYHNTLSTKVFLKGLSNKNRIALMLGLPKDTRRRDIIQTVRKRFDKPIKPLLVKTGPVKENIVIGDEIDLFQFPVPKWHPLDGGRYIDTYSGTVTRDPESGELNVGVYRGMVVRKNRIAKLLAPHQHWGHHFQKYQERKEDMPVALVHGCDDVLPFVAGAPIAHPPDEYEVMGGLKQEPLELVKCETSDLLVPAWAEFVIEGRISVDPRNYEVEGPFGEWTGYYGWSKKRPTLQVDCISYRDDPILRGSIEGSGAGVISEGACAASIYMPALVWYYLEKAGVPGVIDIAFGINVVVKIHQLFAGHARQVAAALFGSWIGKEFLKSIIVVDEDVDIYDRDDLDRAMRDRMDPKDDIVIFPGIAGYVLDPSIPLDLRDEQKYGATQQNKVLYDATIDWVKHPARKEWGGRRYPPRSTEMSPEIEVLVERRWKEYGF
jgi:UbiD family decarboxylase